MHSQLQHIINNPTAFANIDDNQLDSWIKDYPSVSIFYLEKFKRNKDKTQLFNTAFYLADRTILYKIEHEGIKTEAEVKINNETNINVETIELEIISEKIDTTITTDNTIPENLSIADKILQEINTLKQERKLSDESANEIIEDNNNILVEIENNNETAEEIKINNKANIILETVEPEIISEKIDTTITTESTIPENLSIADQILQEINTLKQERRLSDESANENKENNSETTTDLENKIEAETGIKLIDNIDDRNSNEIYIPQISIDTVIDKEDRIEYKTELNLIKIDSTISIFSEKEEKSLADKILEEIQELKRLRQNHENIIDIDNNVGKTNIIVENNDEPPINNEKTNTEAKEDSIIIEKNIIEEKQNNEQHLKIDETHTFLEWLNIVDANFEKNIQKTPEIIQNQAYENQFILDNKKEYLQGILEGETDSIDEIDENVNKLADESISFNVDLATETLAIIFKKQGKINKAIEVYKKLMLKYPEKSNIFETQIENLKNQA
jgi:hypothetical protein